MKAVRGVPGSVEGMVCVWMSGEGEVVVEGVGGCEVEDNVAIWGSNEGDIIDRSGQ